MSRARITVAVLVSVVGVLGAAGCPRPQPAATRDAGRDAGANAPGEATLFFTADLRGEIEPCGCNSNPLGDLSRLAALIEDATLQRGKNAVAWLDGGSMLYSEAPELSAGRRDQERLKAELVLKNASALGLAGAGLGLFDLADGKAAVRPPRQAANVGADQGVALEAPKVIDVGGVRVGVFGLASPDDLVKKGITAADPLATAKQVVPALRKDGAQVIVALTQLDRAGARELARKSPGIDFIVAGRDTPNPSISGGQLGKGIEKQGDSYVIVPSQRGQSVVRVDLHTAAGAPGPLVDAYGEARAKDRIDELATSVAAQEKQLATWKQDPTADPKFLADQQRQLDDWKKESAELAANPLRKPATGSWFTATHVAVQRKLRCDKDVVAAKRAFDKAAAAQNLSAAAAEKPPAVPPGAATYVGIDECGSCHQKAVDFWKTTHHAQAWKTIADVGMEANRDCIRCHVTGWDKPGGASLLGVSKQATLRNVQCEACHGAASKHVESDGKERTTLVRSTPEDTCKTCHELAHSDTFDYQAYLRDITGPGHGEKRHAALGAGKTGHELRQAALAKGAQAIGEGCDRSIRRAALVLTLALVAACGAGQRRSSEPIQPMSPGRVKQPPQEGMASWYGGKFNGKKTASGERFDENALTAAHLHLPFGAKVRVTNLKNGKSVEVRINDRGPWGGHGIIDLSKAAARALGMLDDGRAPVRLEVLWIP